MSHLFRKEFIPELLFFIGLGVLLYFSEQISVLIVSRLLNQSFSYYEPAYLKLIYLILGVVTLALWSIMAKIETVELPIKKRAMSSYLLTILVGWLIGTCVQVYLVYSTMSQYGSLFELEQSYSYYIHDFTLVVFFAIGGFHSLRPILLQAPFNK
jgi:hypothetical protein